MNVGNIAWKIAQMVCDEAKGRYGIDLFVRVSFGNAHDYFTITHLYKPFGFDAYQIQQLFSVDWLRSAESPTGMAMTQYEPLLRQLAEYTSK